MKKVKDILLNIFIGAIYSIPIVILFLGVASVVVAVISGGSGKLDSDTATNRVTNNSFNCYKEIIHFKTEETDDYDSEETYDESLDGEEHSREIVQEGEDGEKEICKGDDGRVEEHIVQEPVNQIVEIKKYEYVEPDYYEEESRVGAICMDGWHSYATGRGACSWHGGVNYWLYE
ncbi:MAG: hypothetical protein Q4A21_00285 [bacterium]|nr:hypothetical protein [bacterium]